MAEIMQAELTKLGWKVSVDNLAAAEYLDRWSKGQFRGLWFGTASFMHMNPSSLFVMAVPFRVPNASNFTSSQYTSLITDMLKTGDETQSKKLYRQMNELLLDECFVLPVSSDDRYVVRTSKIGALPVMRSGPPKLARAWKSK
jgi:ABC-type transport system substrate-binding protein